MPQPTSGTCLNDKCGSGAWGAASTRGPERRVGVGRGGDPPGPYAMRLPTAPRRSAISPPPPLARVECGTGQVRGWGLSGALRVKGGRYRVTLGGGAC